MSEQGNIHLHNKTGGQRVESAYCTVSIDFRSFLLGSYFGIEYLSCVIQFTRYENDHIRRKEERGDCGRQCIKGAHGQLMGTRSVKNVRRKYRTSGHGGHTAVARMGGLGDSESTMAVTRT